MTRTIPERQVEEFSVNQNITYSFSENDHATVQYEIELTNLTSLIYAKEYSLIIDGTQISNISAYDESGSVLKKYEEGKINLEFYSPVVGKDNTKKFTIKFSANNLVQTNGSLKEVILPSVQNPFTTKTNIKIVPAETWGQLARQSIQTQNLSYTSNEKNIPKTSFSFGDAQIITFRLDYYLESAGQIPIPSDSSSQQIRFDKIEPPPANITVDQDGNWFAHYQNKLPVNVLVSGQAKLGPNPNYYTNTDQDYINKTTQTNSIWPKLPESISNPKQAYQKVVDTLSYNTSRASNPSPQSVEELLLSPQNAICTDFTNYFISLARSNNLPSRQIIGYALTNNSEIKPLNQNADILHTWPQYFDIQKQQWIDIDPTWGKTTGVDYFSSIGQNHLAFIIRGSNPDFPLPPGAFKQRGSPKTIKVDYSSTAFQTTQKPLINQTQFSFFEKKEIKTNPNYNSFSNMPPLGQEIKITPTYYTYYAILLLTLVIFILAIIKRK